MRMQTRFAFATLLAATLALSACGFKLRGSGSQAMLPFKTIYIGLPGNSPLSAELKRYLRADGQVTIAEDAKSAEIVLNSLGESREQVVRSLNTQGRVREYTLLYKFRFQVTDGKKNELLAPTQIVLTRVISYNETQPIAKEKEVEMLYRDMQSDLVQQLLRRLSSLKPAAAAQDDAPAAKSM